MSSWLKPSLNWLLIFLPITLWLEYFGHGSATVIFVTACLSILPIAGWLGHATEHLAARTGEGIGGLLNATFGNAAELIIALMALQRGLHEVVKASLTGSIIGNLLLVAGLSIFAGGLKFSTQTFSGPGARSSSTLLWLAAISLVIPATFHSLAGAKADALELDLSWELSVVLLLAYAASLYFSLKTHKQYFSSPETSDAEPGHAADTWSIRKSLGILVGATVLIAWMSEILVGSVEEAAHAFGMTSIFVGVIVVAIVGNAAEHSTAILMALKNKMDLSLGIAIGSSIQIALFVAPVLVLASYFVGPGPMDYVFTPAEVVAVVLSIAITAQVANDGESNWLEGALMLLVYVMLAITFYFLPEVSSAGSVVPTQTGAGH